MNKDRVQLLVDALRSDQYQQAFGVLCQIDPDTKQPIGYCCLGVAAETAMANGLELETGNNSWGYKDYRTYNGEGQYLPSSVVEWYGFEGKNPLLGNALTTAYNDDRRYSFPEIADLFEEKYLEEDDEQETDSNS